MHKEKKRGSTQLGLVIRKGLMTTLDAEARTMVVTAASETPAMVFDWDTAEMVKETLLVSGFQMPANGKQVPLLDSHNRNSVMDVLGSATEFKADGGMVSSLCKFANTDEAIRAMGLYRDGHLTDVSVGYTIDDHEMIPEGKKKTIKGQEYAGPMRLVKKWTIKELSLVPIGADPVAKARAEKSKQEVPMNEFQKWLLERGLSEKTLTKEQLTGLQKDFDTIKAARAANAIKPVSVLTPKSIAPVTAAPVKVPDDPAEKERAEKERAEKEIIEKIRQIELVGRGLGIPQPTIDVIKYTAKDEQEAARAFMKHLAANHPPVPTDIRMLADSETKFRAAASDGLLLSAGIRFKNPAPGADQLSRLGFESMARECLRRKGIDTNMMNKEEILRRAHQMSRGAFPGNDSADFPNILSSSANKAVMVGYGQQPTTYQIWCKIANIRDFKSNSRVRLSDIGVLQQITAQGELKRSAMSETSESYRIYTYGKILGITREMQINDDLNVFSDLFLPFGISSARTVNAVPYAILEANAPLSDTGTLFNTTALTTPGGHANQSSVGGNPSSTTVSAGRAAMRKQTGPNGMKLNIQPQYALVGADNADNMVVVLTSTTLPQVEMPAGTTNPNLNVAIPVVDAEITGNKWFLAANPILVPTVEVGFLNGQQTPTTELRQVSGDILGTDLWCYIDFNAKALSFEGLYYNQGA